MSGAVKRITKVARLTAFMNLSRGKLTSSQEYAELRQHPVEGMHVHLPSESDIHKWEVNITGPKDSPYAVREPPITNVPVHSTPRTIHS